MEFIAHAQQLGDTLLARLNRQCYEFPQEKLHLTTDRSHYMSGDTIWFRGFIVSSATHEPVAVSKYMYVELRSPYNTVDQRIKVIERDGVYAGYVPLDLRIAEGDYTLVAYTNFMKSAGEEYFFKKTVNIRAAYGLRLDLSAHFEWEGQDHLVCKISYKDRTTGEERKREFTYRTINDTDWRQSWRRSGTETIKLDREDYLAGYLLVMCDEYAKYIRLPKRLDEYDVTFHPEGGYLIPGKPCRVAFKAINSYGSGIDITGRIVDSKGDEVAQFKSLHAGMGYFTIIPLVGENYRAECVTQDSIAASFPLPQAIVQAAVISADMVGDTLISITIKGNCPADAVVAIQERGLLVYADRLNGRHELSVLAKGLQSGIVQVLLLDGNLNALSERLLFIEGGNFGAAYIKPSKQTYASRDKVVLEIDFQSYDLPTGSIAVAVTDDLFGKDASTANILTNLLLQSELVGYIENPTFYFEQSDSTRRTALDALLMTQGWRRYDIPAALRGEYQYPSAAIEKSQQISGTVKSLWRGKPLENATVKILSKKIGFARSVRTDSLGRFYFKGFDNRDGATYHLEAVNKKGKTEANMEIDPEWFPEVNLSGVLPISGRSQYFNLQEGWSAERMRLSASGAYNIILDELVVVGDKENYGNKSIFEILAKKSMDSQYMDGRGYTSIEEALRGFPGLRVTPSGNLSYRNRTVAIVVDDVVFASVGDTRSGDASALQARGIVERMRRNRAFGPGPQSQAAGAMALSSTAGSSSVSGGGVLREVEAMYPFTMVERIDFLEPGASLVYGNLPGGAVVITTKEDVDFDLSTQYGIKTFTPLGYQEPAEFYSPKYKKEVNNHSDGLDLRSTVYWNPNIEIGKDGKAKVEFYANDIPKTTYTVLVEGITIKGLPIFSVAIINKN